nr:MAG TPA: hypothetical protein [Caudoviricetes sp.]
MGNTCESLIAQDIKIPCEDQVTKGLESDGLIINRNDIDFAKTVIEGNVIKTLVLKTGKKAYEIRQEGADPFTGTKTELNVGTYRNSWKNTVAIVVLANTPDVCSNIIDGLANGKFVVILRNLSKGADGGAEYQVFGFAQALKAASGENDKYSDDTEGGWLVTLEEESVPKAAYFFFDTSSETTAAKYQSLLTEAS